MGKKSFPARVLLLLLAAALLLSFSACAGNQAVASTMRLMKTEGQVAVSDGKKALDPVEEMLLHDGYQVETERASFGWINLDDAKLTKLDESSLAEVRQAGRDLELVVDRGSLFFHVTAPLEADETLHIRSGNMVTAIRGTCGWVETQGADSMTVYILEGTVECTVAGPEGEPVAVSVTAGEQGRLIGREGEENIRKTRFSAADVPAFVMAEVEEDEALAAAILAASGLDLLHPESESAPPEAENPPEESSPAEPEDEAGPLPSDGDRIVFRGTINTYSYEEVVELQGRPVPNGAGVDTSVRYRLILLDEPQVMSLMSGGGPEMISGEVSMISVDAVENLEAEDGQHLIFSLDPNNTNWPSDASLPMGAPRSRDVRVLD